MQVTNIVHDYRAQGRVDLLREGGRRTGTAETRVKQMSECSNAPGTNAPTAVIMIPDHTVPVRGAKRLSI